jgi:hypothetical protein
MRKVPRPGRAPAQIIIVAEREEIVPSRSPLKKTLAAACLASFWGLSSRQDWLTNIIAVS